MSETYLAPEEYLFHRPPMLLVSRVLAVSEDEVETETDGSLFEPFADGSGRLPESLYVELMAQTVGVWAGYFKETLPKEAGDASVGFLLSARNVQFLRPEIDPKGIFRTKMTKLMYEGKMGSFEGSVTAEDGEAAASGRVSVFQPSAAEFDQMFVKE